MFRRAIFIFILNSILSTGVVAKDVTPKQACDELASHPLDSQRVSDGIDYDMLEEARAEPACRDALKSFPNSSRLQFELGRVLSRTNRNDEAFSLFQESAKAKYPAAVYALSLAFDSGDGTTPDKNKAKELLQQAAELGSSAAMEHLGNRYALGSNGLKKDQTKAARLFKKAAEAGNTNAMLYYGSRLTSGTGVKKNQKLGEKWVIASADAGNQKAMFQLGNWYEEEDVKKAKRWYGLAAEKNHPEALAKLGNIERNEGKKKSELPRVGSDCKVVKHAERFDQAGGTRIGELVLGQNVFLDRWAEPISDGEGKGQIEIMLLDGGKLKQSGYVEYGNLDCAQHSKEFPIVVSATGTLLPLGVYFPSYTENSGDDEAASKSKSPFPNECFHYGGATAKLFLSREFLRKYRAANYNINTLCMVMRSGVMRFDPDTGRRLATFIMVDRETLAKGDEYAGVAVSDEISLESPDCLKSAKVDHFGFYATLPLVSCSMTYHPWSGRKLSEVESKIWRTSELVISGEAAPDPTPEAVKYAKLEKVSTTEADLARLARQLNAK